MFDIKFGFDEETKQFIAEIPSLSLSDYWDTLEEAQKNLMSALQLYIEEKYNLKTNKTQYHETI